MNLIIILFSIFFGWLIFLTYSLFKVKSHYNNLISKTKKRQIDEVLDYLVEKNELFEKDVDQLKKQINNILLNAQFYFQKVGFLRFKPFEQKGEEGFILGFFDEKNNGIIINFIYIHEGLRIYPKIVKKGQGVKYQLTDEEREVIDKSQSLKVLDTNL